jgi:translation initiation factor IF-1
MPRDSLIEFDGTVSDCEGGGSYSILLEDSRTVKAKICGKMKMNKIRVIPGDKVTVGVSPYDLSHGLITRRARNK